MVVIIKLIFITLIITQIGCELPAFKKNIRSPHMPVFADFVPGTESTSNPYWFRATTYWDKQELDMNTGGIHRPEHPTPISSMGTHYKFENDYYLYAMTEGVGAQWDVKNWGQSKLAIGILTGFNKNYGFQVIYSQKMGEFMKAPVIPYISLQRRTIRQQVGCSAFGDHYCADRDYSTNNEIEAHEDIFNAFLGVEVGRIKLGTKGNTTVNVKVEIGTNQIMSRRIDREIFPSNYKHTNGGFIFSVHSGFTLW